MYSFPDLESVCCSMSSSNCCFLTSMHISQEAGQVVWYSHLLKNFPQFIVTHTVKDFGIVNKAEVDVLLEFSCFFSDPTDCWQFNLVPLPFLNPTWASGSSWFTYCWSLTWRILSFFDKEIWLLWQRLREKYLNWKVFTSFCDPHSQRL